MMLAYLLAFNIGLRPAVEKPYMNPVTEAIVAEMTKNLPHEEVEEAPAEEEVAEEIAEEDVSFPIDIVMNGIQAELGKEFYESTLPYVVEPMEPYDFYPITTVNVRSLPTVESDIVRQVTISDTVTAVGVVNSYEGKECFFYELDDGNFISATYVSVEKTVEYTIPAYYTPVVIEGVEYYTCGNTITLPSGGYNINTDYIGLKVVWTNRALLGSTNARYTADTYNAVVALQTNAGLPVTGEVDLATWLAMGYTEDEWYNLGTYITPLKVSAGATHDECVAAMLQTAVEYMNAGTDYRIGCSGAPGQYADCSGFIFQCLYSIGVNPTINIVDHALAIKEYTSRDLCADDRLGLPVSYEDMQPGDIIFYSSNGVNVTHVALYAGNGKMYDSNSGGVLMRNIWGRSSIVKIVRVCP